MRNDNRRCGSFHGAPSGAVARIGHPSLCVASAFGASRPLQGMGLDNLARSL
jgi:hypothetical protein